MAAFLDVGAPPVYVGFGGMTMRTSTDVARVTIEAIRTEGAPQATHDAPQFAADS